MQSLKVSEVLPAAPSSVSVRWITSRNFDLLFFIGACITSYAVIFANVFWSVSALFLYWFWIVSVDGPHVFGTISRTYLDRQEWKTRGTLLKRSLLWFLPGPISLLISMAVKSPIPFFVFLVLAQLWAYWHVVRQHYGFMSLYQKKNQEPSGRANAYDYWIFYILMLAPFISFLLRHPDARRELGLPPAMSSPEQWVVAAIYALTVGAILFYIAKETFLRATPLNVPKNLFLLACIPLHLLIFLHPYISTRVDVVLFAVFVTFYHNIQYHGIVWFYNRNRYGNDPEGERYGAAGKVSRNFLTYYAAGLVFTILYRYSNWFFTGLSVPFGFGPNAISKLSIGGMFQVSHLAIGFWWGFAFNHYYLDQKIWKISKDQQLSSDLKLVTAG